MLKWVTGHCEVLKDYSKLWHVDDLWTPVKQLWDGVAMTNNLSNLFERGLCLCFTNDFLSCCLKTRIYPLGHLKRWNFGISHMCFSGVKQDVISCWNPSINIRKKIIWTNTIHTTTRQVQRSYLIITVLKCSI